MNDFDLEATLPAGTVIGERYRILRLLGQGGMGAVYEAENTWTKRRVAIKLLLPALSGDARAVARFQGEAQAATKLQHPNIVDVLDMGRDAHTGIVYIVQEFLRGEDLHNHLKKRRRLTPAQAVEIMVPIMAALSVAHERNIIHRDIKPENIFLVGSGTSEITPKLIDFGLAKVLGEDAKTRKTNTGTIMGTPYYMSPEQARGDRDINARSDIWAIGAVFFELLTGEVPYDADTANLIIVKLITQPPPRLLDRAPELPPDVGAIIGRAMEPDLNKRYQTMREMLAHVLACSGFQNIEASRTLRDRFARSIEHVPPADTDADTGTGGDIGREPTAMARTESPVSSTPTRALGRASRGSQPGLLEGAERRPPTQESWERERVASAITPPPSSRGRVALTAILGLLVGVGGLGLALRMKRGSPMDMNTPAPPPATAPPQPPATAASSGPNSQAAAPVSPAAPATAPAATVDAGMARASSPTTEREPASERRHRRHRRRTQQGAQDDALAPVGP